MNDLESGSKPAWGAATTTSSLAPNAASVSPTKQVVLDDQISRVRWLSATQLEVYFYDDNPSDEPTHGCPFDRSVNAFLGAGAIRVAIDGYVIAPPEGVATEPVLCLGEVESVVVVELDVPRTSLPIVRRSDGSSILETE